MTITVVPYRSEWPDQFEVVAAPIRAAVSGIRSAAVEHVGSTSVPGLAAKPILDIDVVVDRPDVPAAIDALSSVGYAHRGDLGIAGREAFVSPDDRPPRHVYVCERGTLNVRNHLAVRDVLRRRRDLRDEYGAVKAQLAADPDISIDAYVAGKSAVLQKILAESDFTSAELTQILRRNDPSA